MLKHYQTKKKELKLKKTTYSLFYLNKEIVAIAIEIGTIIIKKKSKK